MNVNNAVPKIDPDSKAFVERVLENQKKLSAELKRRYDFIVCGSGSSGSVVAARLTENPEVSVLLANENAMSVGASRRTTRAKSIVVG